jgi:hypothetical protein
VLGRAKALHTESDARGTEELMNVDEEQLVRTRQGLHGVAEYVLAGPQYVMSGDIRLRVVPGGFATRRAPDLRVEGVELVTPDARLPLTSTFAELAKAAGIEARHLRDVYPVGPELHQDDAVRVDPDAVATILDAFVRGDAAMRELSPGSDPVLWPEHFDVAATEDEVNYGVSAGDDYHPTPYAYVAPWRQRTGPFWEAPFGAVYPLNPAHDVDALLSRIADFFQRGQREL